MKYFKLIFLGLVNVFLLGACSDFLEEKSQDEVLVRTVEDYSELLLGYMDAGGYDLLYALDDDIQIDERKFSPDGSESYSISRYSGCFAWQPDMWERENKLLDGYQFTYDRLAGINSVLNGIDNAIGSQDEKERVKAEALFMRGFYYYMLVNLFGEPYNYNKEALGVPLKLTAGLMENGIARGTVEEVYSRIVEDLKASSTLYERYPKQRQNYRINGTTVDILLSRVYLYMEEWENVIMVATKAIESAEGLTDYTKISTSSQFTMATYAHSEVEWLYGYNQVPVQFGPSEDLLSKYKMGDRRVNFWFHPTFNVVKKNVQDVSPTNTIRISEAYLNRAEAYVRFKKNTEALSDLNKLRCYRIVGYEDESITDSGKLLDEIRLERRLELCFDWQRWFDLRRYGMPSISHDYRVKKAAPWMTYTLKEKDPLYTLPIPTLMMKNNIKLEQNPSAGEPIRAGVLKSNL